MAEDEQRLREVQREYLDFLDDEVSNIEFKMLFRITKILNIFHIK